MNKENGLGRVDELLLTIGINTVINECRTARM